MGGVDRGRRAGVSVKTEGGVKGGQSRMVSRRERVYFLRLGALSGFDRTLRELGVDPEPLLQAQGLSSADLAEGDRLITLEQSWELLDSAARATACPTFALELAARQDVSLLGAIGLLLQTADTVRQALQDVTSYLRSTHVSYLYWNLVRRGNFDAFEFSAEPTTLNAVQKRMVTELALAQCYRILHSVSAGRLQLACVCFRHGDERALPALRRFFHCPVQVNADFDGLLFRDGAIDMRIERADTQLHETARRLIQGQQKPLSEDSLADQVKVLIRPLLPTGQCSLERVARFFACDKRTLQRNLRAECDTTYQSLLDEVRFEAACFYLSESDLSITQLAQLSGFSEATNFSRAFRGRFGVSPRGWRQAHQ